MSTDKNRLSGRIIVVQEDRFLLADGTGRRYLFMLSHKARASEEDLQRWRRAGIPVITEYEGEPHMASGVAHKVEPLPDYY